jgi:hypothetical protein
MDGFSYVGHHSHDCAIGSNSMTRLSVIWASTSRREGAFLGPSLLVRPTDTPNALNPCLAGIVSTSHRYPP